MELKHYFFVLLMFSSTSCYAEKQQVIHVDGSTGVRPLIVAMAEQYQQYQDRVSIKIGDGMKPSQRFPALMSGDIDLVMASHGLKLNDLNHAPLLVNQFAKVAIVFGLHHVLGSFKLSEQNLCDIFAGKLNNWSQLAGPDLAIVPFIRPEHEVDTEIARAHIDCFKNLKWDDKVIIKQKSGDMAKAIETVEGAIGLTTMIRVAQSHGKIIPVRQSSLRLDGDSISMSRDLFLVSKENASSAVKDFIDFVFGEKGRAILIQNHAIPVNVQYKLQ